MKRFYSSLYQILQNYYPISVYFQNRPILLHQKQAENRFEKEDKTNINLKTTKRL